ncbi:MAG: NADPH:quinone oxidoreductase family protein, partial [Actinomycetota bacterium]
MCSEISGAIAPANHALVKNYSVVGVHMGGYRGRDNAALDRCYDEVYRMLVDGAIAPLISEHMGLADVPRALKLLAD